MLFRGIGVVAGAAGPAHALYFSSYEFAKKLLSSDKRSNVLAQGVCVGVGVGVCTLPLCM